MVFHPVEWHAKRPRPCSRRKVEVKTESSTLKRVAVNIKGNLRLLRSGRVIIIGLVLGINVMGLFNFYYLVPFAMKAAGHTADEVGMCLLAAGITVLVTRFCQPLIVMWANLTHQTALMMGSTIIATSTVVFAWSDTLIQKMTALGTFGIGHGFFFTSYNLVMVEVLGLPLLQPMLSVTGLFKSSSFLIFGPLIGLVRDLSGSFPVCLTLLGVIDFFSIALWILIPFARRYDHRREHLDE